MNAPKIRDHVFMPGDATYGQELECRVSAPVREAGRWVRAHCGYPPEEHVQTDDPNHARHCDEYNYGDARPCNCWVSAPRLTGQGDGE